MHIICIWKIQLLFYVVSSIGGDDNDNNLILFWGHDRSYNELWQLLFTIGELEGFRWIKSLKNPLFFIIGTYFPLTEKFLLKQIKFNITW